MGFGGESLEDTGEFDGDVAGANEDHFCRLALELEESVGSDAVFGAGDVFGDDWVATYTPSSQYMYQTTESEGHAPVAMRILSAP